MGRYVETPEFKPVTNGSLYFIPGILLMVLVVVGPTGVAGAGQSCRLLRFLRLGGGSGGGWRGCVGSCMS